MHGDLRSETRAEAFGRQTFFSGRPLKIPLTGRFADKLGLRHFASRSWRNPTTSSETGLSVRIRRIRRAVAHHKGRLFLANILDMLHKRPRRNETAAWTNRVDMDSRSVRRTRRRMFAVN